MQVLDEGFCFQEGTKPQPQPCVLEGQVPKPPHFSLGHEPWHKSLAFACALSFECATWHMPGDSSFFTPTAASVEMLPSALRLAEELLFQPSGIHCSLCSCCLWSDAIKKPGPVASVRLYLIPAVLQVLSMQVSKSSSRPWQLSCRWCCRSLEAIMGCATLGFNVGASLGFYSHNQEDFRRAQKLAGETCLAMGQSRGILASTRCFVKGLWDRTSSFPASACQWLAGLAALMSSAEHLWRPEVT